MAEKIARILVYSTTSKMVGGVERYIQRMVIRLKEKGVSVDGCFEELRPQDALYSLFDHVYTPDHPEKMLSQPYDWVSIQRIENVEMLQLLQSHFKTHLMVHDHDFYCPRRSKYFPFTLKNCHRAACRIPCWICGSLARNSAGKFRIFNYGNFKRRLDLLKKCDRVSVLSDFMKGELVKNGFNATSVHLLAPPFDHPPQPVFKNDPDAVPMVLFVGQVIRGKGIDLLLNALTKIKCPYRCMIVGDGNGMEACRELADQLNLKDKVTFTGHVPSVANFYGSATVLAVPSRWQEPYGLIGDEAMYLGVPVVGFDVGGVSQWLHDGQNGFLVPEGDLTLFAQRLEQLMSDGVLREKLSVQARKDSQAYAQMDWSQDFLEMLNRT